MPAKRRAAPPDPAAVAHAPAPAAEWLALSALKPWPENPKKPTAAEVQGVAASIERFGFGAPLVARLADHQIIAGHTRWLASKKLGLAEIPVRFLDLSEHDARLLALADNELGADWEPEALLAMLGQLAAEERRLAGWSDEAFAELSAQPASAEPAGPGLTEKFGAPPFSVFDAKQGYWQERKRAWLALGIASEIGRGENLLKFSDNMIAAQNGEKPYARLASAAGRDANALSHTTTSANMNFYSEKRKLERRIGQKLSTPEARERLVKEGKIEDFTASGLEERRRPQRSAPPGPSGAGGKKPGSGSPTKRA